MSTELTDEGGNDLGTAFDVIADLERIAGHITAAVATSSFASTST